MGNRTHVSGKMLLSAMVLTNLRPSVVKSKGDMEQSGLGSPMTEVLDCSAW